MLNTSIYITIIIQNLGAIVDIMTKILKGVCIPQVLYRNIAQPDQMNPQMELIPCSSAYFELTWVLWTHQQHAGRCVMPCNGGSGNKLCTHGGGLISATHHRHTQGPFLFLLLLTLFWTA